MKICLINNLYEPYSRGGAEQVVKNIAGGFVSAGHEVIIITSKPLALTKAMADKKENIKIHRFFPWNLFWIGNISKHNSVVRLMWHFLDIFNLHSYFKIRQILKQEKPSLVIAHNLKGLGYLIPLAINKMKIKYFHTLHDVQLAIPSGLLIKGQEDSWQNNCFLTKLYKRINKKLFSYPQVIISPSNWLLDFYVKKGFFKNQKKEVMPNPTIKSEIRPVCRTDRNPKSETNLKFQTPNNKLTFLYVGQIEEHKGILFLINVFNKIKNNDVGLLVVGDGSKLEEAKKIAGQNNRIKFLGRLPNKEVINLYKKSNITIMSSLCYENSPTVVYESLTYGVPVMVSNIGGSPELIKEGETGFIFKAGSKEDLLEKINFCINNKEKLSQMRENSIDSIKNFDLKNYINKIISKY